MSFSALQERVEDIAGLLRQIASTQRLPDQRASAALAISPEYYSQINNTALLELFKESRRRFAEEERRQGEIARDRELRRLAVELDRARVELRDIAQAASFNLLDVSRECRA